MVNFREVNDDDILKDWLMFREDSLLCQLSDEDYKHGLNFDKFCEMILRNFLRIVSSLFSLSLISCMMIL